MTLEEALEYLNLPANSREQLIRKRYLELKKDYLKAIYNAPSDHFSTLYRENLQKIEEAYRFLMGKIDGFTNLESQIEQSVTQIQKMVKSLLRDRKVLDKESRRIVRGYVEQVDHLKEALMQESYQVRPQADSIHHPAWHWEVDELKKASTAVGIDPSTEVTTKEDPSLLQKLIAYIVGVPYMETTGARKNIYDRFLMGIILTIVILGILGTLYVMFPLLID